jgi:hypothetical protein
LKFNRKLMAVLAPMAALLLLVAAFVAVGAKPSQGINVPPGAIVDSPNAQVGGQTQPRPVPAAPGLTAAAQPGTTDYTFDSGNLSAFQQIASEDAGTEWVIKDGRLAQTYAGNGGATEEVSQLVTKDAGLANGSVETYFYPTAGSPLGIVVRGSNAGHYLVVLNMNVPNDSAKAWIERVEGDKAVRIATAPASVYGGYSLETWQNVKVTLAGDRITVLVGGKEIVSATDTTFAAGWAGVWTLADRGTQFDNVRIVNAAAR